MHWDHERSGFRSSSSSFSSSSLLVLLLVLDPFALISRRRRIHREFEDEEDSYGPSTWRHQSAPIGSVRAATQFLKSLLFRSQELCVAMLGFLTAAAHGTDLSPVALATGKDGTLYVGCAGTKEVLVFNSAAGKIDRRLALPGVPSGLAISADGARLFVTCAAPESRVCVLDTSSGQVTRTLTAGHTSLGPVLSRDGKLLFVCNRFNDDVSVFELTTERELCRIPVRREPVSAALTADGRHLLVANHLPRGRSDVPYVAATVSVIDVATRKLIKDLRLPNGSINLRQISVSPDGRYACMPLSVGRFQVPVTQLDRGWVNTSAVTLIDLLSLEVLNTVLLDDVDHGAAKPWATRWSADGRLLYVTHAGTHELSIVDLPALLEKLSRLPEGAPTNAPSATDPASRCRGDVVNDLSFMHDVRRRIKLNGNGPRALATIGSRVYVANYFSGRLDVLDMTAPKVRAKAIPLNPSYELTNLRRGEMYFNDASLCFQGWQSCASCHDDDGRVDGLNWDLLNDGIGNPKDTKSLVLSHRTPPVMSLGVRSSAEIAVRSGIQNSLGATLPAEVPAAMDAWLKSLEPGPSPRLVQGKLSEAARRGEKIFKNAEIGCSGCHEGELLTDLQSYNVGTRNEYDREDRVFDTPTLHELWRTAPYLHDGSAATLRDVLTTRNPKDEHGKTSHLSPRDLDDLIEYVLSL